jgi:hypothetical protein
MTRENREAVKTVLQNSQAPIAATQIRKELPKSLRIPPKELDILLHEMTAAGEIFPWPGKKFWDRDPRAAVPSMILDFLAASPVATTGKLKMKLRLPLEWIQPALADLVGPGRVIVWQPGKTPYYCFSEPVDIARQIILEALADGPLTEKDLTGRVRKKLPGYQMRHLREHIAHAERILVHPRYGKEKTRYGLKPPEPKPYLTEAVREISAVQRVLAPFQISLEEILDALRTQLMPEQRTITPRPQTVKDGTPHPDAEQLVLEGIGRLQPLGQRRALVSIRELRRSLGLPMSEFDRAVFSLALQGRVVLHQHDFPTSLGPAERGELLRDERGTYYVGIVPKEMSCTRTPQPVSPIPSGRPS